KTGDRASNPCSREVGISWAWTARDLLSVFGTALERSQLGTIRHCHCSAADLIRGSAHNVPFLWWYHSRSCSCHAGVGSAIPVTAARQLPGGQIPLRIRPPGRCRPTPIGSI